MDRGKPGSKMHVLSDANGLPLAVGASAANVHDSEGLKPMVQGHQTRHDPHRGRHFKPQRLHADKAYGIPHLRKWLRGKRIGVRIARKGIESSERLPPAQARQRVATTGGLVISCRAYFGFGPEGPRTRAGYGTSARPSHPRTPIGSWLRRSFRSAEFGVAMDLSC